MRLYPERLSSHLQNPSHIYVVYGNEPFFIEESARLIRNTFKGPDVEHDIVNIENTQSMAQWEGLLQNSHHSLFTQKRFLDIRIYGKMTSPLAQFLEALLHTQTNDLLILVQAQQLTKTQLQAPWFILAEQRGSVVAHWALNTLQYSKWIAQKVREHNLLLSKEALHLLQSYTQNNPLAALAEIERLALYYLDQKETIHTLFLNENNQFDVFSLCEAALSQKHTHALKIIACFKQNGVIAPSLILWALAQTLRALLQGITKTSDNEKKLLLKQHAIRESLHPVYLNSIQNGIKNNSERVWRSLLNRVSCADKEFKSGELNAMWRSIIEISLGCSGSLIFSF